MNATKGLVVPAGGGKHLDMTTPGRFAALKLLGHETNESSMLFEETVPVGTKSLFHLHRDSDEVAWVPAGEITFKIGDGRPVSLHPGRRRQDRQGPRRDRPAIAAGAGGQGDRVAGAAVAPPKPIPG